MLDGITGKHMGSVLLACILVYSVVLWRNGRPLKRVLASCVAVFLIARGAGRGRLAGAGESLDVAGNRIRQPGRADLPAAGIPHRLPSASACLAHLTGHLRLWGLPNAAV